MNNEGLVQHWIGLNMDLLEKLSKFGKLLCQEEVIFSFSITTIVFLMLIAFIVFLIIRILDREICQIDEESGFDPPPEYSEEAPPPTYDEAVIIEINSSNAMGQI